MAENTYKSIRIDDKGIFELAGARHYGGDTKENISRVVLKYEAISKRPILTIVFGILFCLIGMFGFTAFITWIKNGGALALDETTGLLSFLLLGLWLLWSALSKKSKLIVYTNTKKHSLIFREAKDKEEVKKFVREKCEEFGYDYEIIA